MTWKWNNGHVKLTRKSTESFSSLNVTFKDKSIKSVINLPNSAELIIMTEGERFFIWIDSVLLLDLVISTANWSSFAFEAQGNSYVEDCVFMGNPRTEIEYMDDWGEKMQTIQLESDKSVLVKQILYDSLGRPAIETKLTRVTVDKRKSLLTYHSNFISGSINPSDPHSVWKSHRLQGEVDRLNPLDGGVPYFRTEYEANPLNEKQINGQPGPDFAVNGSYAMKFRTNIKKDKINVISNHFPTRQGFRYKMEEKPNGTKKVAVFDRHNNNRVALYVYVPGYDHLLSTYEYDSQNRLIKILPPLYHERVHTFGKSNLNTTEEMDLQKSLGTFMSYDETGRLIRKTTPDTGCVEYYYNRQDQIRLQVHSQSEESDIAHEDPVDKNGQFQDRKVWRDNC
jgi:YD repeat-containing protein